MVWSESDALCGGLLLCFLLCFLLFRLWMGFYGCVLSFALGLLLAWTDAALFFRVQVMLTFLIETLE